MEEMLIEGGKLAGWNRRVPPSKKTGDIKRGLGVARGFHTSGTGGPNPGEVIDYSSATIKINEDGSVDVLTALMDLGGGTWDAGAKVVAEVLKVPYDKVGIYNGVDTRSTGYDVNTHATRGVYCGCGAIKFVAEKVKEILLGYAATLFKDLPDNLELAHNDELGQAIIYPKGLPENYKTVGEIAKTAQIKSWGTIAYTGSLRQKNCPPCFITHFVEVEVNTKTGEIKIPRAVIIGDSGTIINPDLWEGQIIGAFSRGLGFGLLEETRYDLSTGELECKGFITDFKTATTCEMPKIDQLTVLSTDTYEPTGPFGAKGIGEAALSSVASAIANAVYNAIGIRFYNLPITPEKVLKALEEKEERGEKIAD